MIHMESELRKVEAQKLEELTPLRLDDYMKRLRRFVDDIIEAFFGLFTGSYRDEQ